MTESVAFSPGAYEALSRATFTDAGVVEPTRTVTAADLISVVGVVAVADARLVT